MADNVWSTIVMFVLAFAVLGLLLGFAEVYDTGSDGQMVISAQTGSTNSTAADGEEEVASMQGS